VFTKALGPSVLEKFNRVVFGWYPEKGEVSQFP
jgi:hypothetical protein